ncbi:U-box domain-containing protein 33 [Bienertia sinuspersici]
MGGFGTHHELRTISTAVGMKFPVSSLAEQEVIAHREKEKQDMCKMLDDCGRICTRAQFKVEKLYTEKDNVESGLVELISQHKIKKLVMGAASDKKNSSSFSAIFDFRKMTEPKSKKANYVRQHAPAYCHIWFTCKGDLIYTREAVQQSQLNDEHQNGQANSKRLTKFSSELSITPSRVNSEESFDRSSTFSLSPASSFYQSSVSTTDSASSHSRTEEREQSFRSLTLMKGMWMMHYIINLIKPLQRLKLQNNKQFKSQQDVANATESKYYEELRRRKELEEELAKAKEKFKTTKERDLVVDELRVAVDQKLLLKNRAEKFDSMDSWGNHMGSSREIEGEAGKGMVADNKIFVAVCKELKESKSKLIWALKNFNGKNICIIYVHVPAKMIPMPMGGKFPVSQVGEKELKAFRKQENREILKTLDDYLQLCAQVGVHAEKIHVAMDSVEEGIVEIISQQKIGRLVMGAAADSRFSREAVRQPSPDLDGILSNSLENDQFTAGFLSQELNSRLELSDFGGYGGSSDGFDQSSRVSFSPSSMHSLEAESALSSPCSSFAREEVRESGLELLAMPSTDNKHQGSSPPSVLQESSMNDDLYDKLVLAMKEAENSRREAFDESMRRRKAEKEALEAIRKAKSAESLYFEEVKQRKEKEEKLAKWKEELEITKKQWKKVSQKLHEALDRKSSLETQLEQSKLTEKEMEEKILSAVDLLQKYKTERDELQLERDHALREAEELRNKFPQEPSSSYVPFYFSEFSFSDLQNATNNFSPSLKIGEGGYGSIYKGFLRHTEVAIKILNPSSMQGPREFEQEVDVLSKLRHPNLVTLIGACPESWALVYEYLSGGSLEDRLICKDNTPPLPWQTRIQIATELCSVLIFLHSSRPTSVIHGDLKPSNILLDDNYVCKLSDFGICCIISNNEQTARFCTTQPKGTFTYMDPELLSTGELTPKSDIYSFGVIVLRLLTGKPAMGIAKEVEYALNKGSLNSLLDPSAGDWPFVQAEQLARMALRCCDIKGNNRPDLGSDVWRVLEPMKASSRSLSKIRSAFDDRVPHYFICPIFQEIMEDPQIASDGFTYEAEAIRGWLDSGHDTSPMTSVKLSSHDFIPNHTLRSAIQEWIYVAVGDTDELDKVMKRAIKISNGETICVFRVHETSDTRTIMPRKKVSQKLHEALDRKSSLETQFEKSKLTEKEMEEKILSAMELLQKYKTERDELQLERDHVLREAQELRNKLTQEPLSSYAPFYFSEFSFSDLQNATNNFNPSLKIGEGGHGSIYKGFLHHTEVAIKILNPREFEQEVDVLSKLRHPNLVTLIGACPESWALVYEYLSGGSLEDRLICKDNTPPLPWQTRIQIATELCSVLIFLHSSRPTSVIHGDLKPSNILLDDNFVCKLSDFGICCIISNNEQTARFCTTQPKGTFTYMDPELLSTGELTPKSDIYSFGVIVLRLLTGKPAMGIAKEVEYALNKGSLNSLLDPSAGDWPFVQAEQLARMALRCCDIKGNNRPELGSDVWRVLEPMKASSRSLSKIRSAFDDDRVPHYFICPIFQEIMEDPQIASDGFTYEAEAIRRWLDSGQDTSPMTNVKLSSHDFFPNHTLRSAIQKWVKDIQRFCIGELRQMKEKHEESKKEHEFTKTLLEKVLQEFHKTLNQKLTLENQYEKTYLSEKELEENLLLAVDLSQKYKNYGEQMEEEKNHALKEAQELRNQLDHETSMSQVPILEFLFLDLDKATNFFDATMKIGEGGKGTTYKGVLHHTNVAITMLNPNTISGPQEFKQEALVYEYLSRGSLEDRLICKDNTLPLTWKTRIQIATQLCYVLTFLHSSCPSSIIHGNLKPSNILLDDNFTCKLHDFGTCSIIPNDTEKTSSFITNFQKRREKRFNNTELDTFTYMDPNCLAAEELTPKADVYSFGIILLRLITGKPAFGLAKEMKCVLDKGDLNDILDPLVRDRPYVQAEQLARLALRCCDMDPMSRPDIFEIWKVLESMKASSQSLRHLLDSEDHVPAYFICPITQSIKEWLGSGHCTSPMTLVKLANKNLVPNHALRVYKLNPGLEHYSCMVDLLGRKGKFKEALEFIEKMSFDPDAAIWGALLSACKIHNNVEIGEYAAYHLYQLDPQAAVLYVEMANMYASAGRWDSVSKVRTLMKCNKVKKYPGQSFIQVDGKNHIFGVEERWHPEGSRIYEVLDVLAFGLKEDGMSYHYEDLSDCEIDLQEVLVT